MEEQTITRTTRLKASPAEVWDALTTPEKTKLYMFNCAVNSDWKAGSPITWKGNYQGYESAERGTIKVCHPQKELTYTSFDPNFGLEDKEENYLLISYELEEDHGQTALKTTIHNYNNDPERLKHIAAGWDNVVLPGIEHLFS